MRALVLLAFLADAAAAQVRPAPRPGDLVEPDKAAVAAPAVAASDRPVPRPAMSRPARPRVEGGGLCGRPSLAGEAIGVVRGQGACGIPQAVRVRAAGGITLSRPVRMDCTAARALDEWVTTGVIPVIGGRGGGVARIETVAGYACRTRNSQRGARLSEHALGRAVDVAGFRFLNGEVLSVLQDWSRGSDGRILDALWRSACGPFTTVLGPNADRFHRDHFHLDVASDRRRAYCR